MGPDVPHFLLGIPHNNRTEPVQSDNQSKPCKSFRFFCCCWKVGVFFLVQCCHTTCTFHSNLKFFEFRKEQSHYVVSKKNQIFYPFSGAWEGRMRIVSCTAMIFPKRNSWTIVFNCQVPCCMKLLLPSVCSPVCVCARRNFPPRFYSKYDKSTSIGYIDNNFAPTNYFQQPLRLGKEEVWQKEIHCSQRIKGIDDVISTYVIIYRV